MLVGAGGNVLVNMRQESGVSEGADASRNGILYHRGNLPKACDGVVPYLPRPVGGAAVLEPKCIREGRWSIRVGIRGKQKDFGERVWYDD